MAKETLHSISLGEAVELTTRYRENRPQNFPICETFDKESIRKMLSYEGATGMRIYLGEKEDGNVCTVICAVDTTGNDILPPPNASNKTNEDDALILDDAIRCPELCPPPSPLNP
jgi:hypothetical protein